MNQSLVLEQIKEAVYNRLKNDATGHDYFHIERVVNNTKRIAQKETCNLEYAVQLAYLHDVGDYKLHNGVDKTEEIVTEILSDIGYDAAYIKQMIADIDLIGFKGGFNRTPTTKEVQVVQDADRLDSLGAIGIGRTFAYGGKKGRLMHDPNFQPKAITNEEEYKTTQAPTIQHFYDKLLKLKDLMNTETGKQLAQERHDFMELYLKQFYKEWKGE